MLAPHQISIATYVSLQREKNILLLLQLYPAGLLGAAKETIEILVTGLDFRLQAEKLLPPFSERAAGTSDTGRENKIPRTKC